MIARPLDAARDALIVLQGQLIAVLAAQNAALAERVGEREDRLARLQRSASRNSGNSSLPPSRDDQPGRTPPPEPRRGRRAERNPGKQPAAPGSQLAWSENPDRMVPHFPRGGVRVRRGPGRRRGPGGGRLASGDRDPGDGCDGHPA